MDDQALDVIEDVPDTQALQRAAPVSITDLAALKSEAIDIIDTRVEVITTLRLASLRATFPEDWLLFKAPDGTVRCYLEDVGCQRVRDFWGISIFDIGKLERIPATGEPFCYLITGSGKSSITKQVVEQVEGGRASTDDFCRGKTGAELELAVRKAARANLDGGLTRALAGLKSVPMEELQRAWQGTPKTTDRCTRGRGFGTKEERAGGERADAPQLVPPKCEVCGAVGVFRTSTRGGFYGCPDWKKHEDRKWSVDLKKWEADPRARGSRDPAPSFFREPGEDG